MLDFAKKSKRLDPVIEERKIAFDNENSRLTLTRKRKIETIAAMKAKQREYLDGVHRLNVERTTTDRRMLEALEGGLDAVKQQWMKLYNDVLVCEKEEAKQLEIMAKAHKALEAIKHLKNKYERSLVTDMNRKEQKQLDEMSLRKFNQQSTR